MIVRTAAVVLVISVCCSRGSALEPGEILVMANRDVPTSMRIAEYYCARRKVPRANLLILPLGKGLTETISRADYNKKLAGPIRKELSTLEFAWKIRCLLTTFGVPIKVGGRGLLKGQEDKLRHLEGLLKELKSTVEKVEQSNSVYTPGQEQQVKRRLAQLESEIDGIKGKETDASVDSELSMVLFGDYELYRWRPNLLKNSLQDFSSKTLMVARLDGPGEDVLIGLVDKAIEAEKKGLRGQSMMFSCHAVQSIKFSN